VITSARLRELAALTGDHLCDICDRETKPQILRRTAYGNMRHCHRCWVDLFGEETLTEALATSAVLREWEARYAETYGPEKSKGPSR
jgi:hypothetical protein